MKFHAEMINSSNMKEFALIISTLKHMDEKMYLKICPDRMILFVPSSTKTDSICSFDIAQRFFDFYLMSGIDQNKPEENFIYLEVTTSNMSAAFSTLNKNNPINKVKINLVSANNYPCLAIQIFVVSSGTADLVDVVNEVPVLIIPRLHWTNYEIPSISDFAIFSNLPKYRALKKYIDTHKTVSKNIMLEFKKDDSFAIKAKNDSTSVCSRFTYIKCQAYSGNTQQPQGATYNADDIVTILDSKKFANLLHSIQFQYAKLKCVTREDGPFKIFFNVGEHVEASCYLSVMSSDDD